MAKHGVYQASHYFRRGTNGSAGQSQQRNRDPGSTRSCGQIPRPQDREGSVSAFACSRCQEG